MSAWVLSSLQVLLYAHRRAVFLVSREPERTISDDAVVIRAVELARFPAATRPCERDVNVEMQIAFTDGSRRRPSRSPRVGEGT